MAHNILLIDDDPLVSKTLCILLSKQGYQVDSATNAIEALTQVATKDFDLVISDIRMPGDNGIVAIQKIKEVYSARKHICTYVFISGFSEEDTPSHAIRLGVDKFVDKPFDVPEILKTVAEELDIVLKQRELMEPRKPAILKMCRSVTELTRTRRVVITGIGVVSPNGIGREAYWNGLRKGVNSVDFISAFDTATFPCKVAAEVKNFDPMSYIDDSHQIKRMGRSSHLGVAAAKLAIVDAGLVTFDDENVDVFIGSATSGLDYAEPEIRALERGGVRKVKPYAGIAGFGGAISGEVARAIGAKGSCLTFSNGCTSATDAIGYALKQLRYGLSDMVVAGGADACVIPAVLAAFCQMGAVSFRNDRAASRPFNKDRDGFVIAEGGWMFLLEELEHAIKRKATIYGELAGYGATCDAWHMSKPYPTGEYTAKAIHLAIENAGLLPTQIDVFEAYGNATPVNDSYETAVIKKVFGEHSRQLVVPSVKSMIGHPIGAAGGQQLAAALLAINEDFVHPTINYELPDPECDLDYVANYGRNGRYNAALCNSLAFGGKNAAIVVKKFEK